MSILNYFRKIDKLPSDNDEGLKGLLGPHVLKEANAELKTESDIDSPEPGCSTGPSSQTKFVFSNEVLLNKFSPFPQCFENNGSLLHTF